MSEAERRGLYLGPGNWIQWMTLAELQARKWEWVDDPKEYVLSLWDKGKRRPTGEFIKYRVYLILEMEDHQNPPIPPDELNHQIKVIPGNWIENLEIVESYISVCEDGPGP